MNDRIKSIEDSIADNEIDEILMEESIKIIKERNIGSKAIIPLLELLERNPLVSFGKPGAIVHYLESLDGYREELIKSIKRAPTLHTIWMINRCINAHDEREKDYMELLKSVTLKNDLDNNIRECAKEFLDYQENETI